MKTTWKPVPVAGFEDIYEVSNTGKVRRIKVAQGGGLAVLTTRSWNKPGYRYPKVTLNNNRRAVTRKVHQLVAEAFLGPCPIGKEVNHKDGNPINNRWDNLEYVTHPENVTHSYELGLRKPSKPLSRLGQNGRIISE